MSHCGKLNKTCVAFLHLQGGALTRDKKGEENGEKAAKDRREDQDGRKQARPAAPLPSLCSCVLTVGLPVSQGLPVAPLFVQGAVLGLQGSEPADSGHA